MAQNLIYFICGILVIFAAGVFAPFVMGTLSKINTKTDSIPKHHWGMGVYIDNIPQNEQNTARLVSVPLKIYERSEYSDIPVPRKGEEIFGVYYSGQYRFDMTGTVTRVFYNTDIDWIVVHCKCTEITRRDKNA